MAELSIAEVAELMSAKPILSDPGERVGQLLYDSRQLYRTESVLFIALKGKNHNGHNFIPDLAQKGIVNFCVSEPPVDLIDGCNYLLVEDSLQALQDLAAGIRSSSMARFIGITGSNGKTTVKSWLTEILRARYKVCSTPKSYNSQIGVPLSVFELEADDDLGIFEAGISEVGEMGKLEKILRPEIGIFTNIGSAHDQFFESRAQKISEKLKLFSRSESLIYEKADSELSEAIEAFATENNIELWSWSKTDPSADLYISNWKRIGNLCMGYAIFYGKKITLKAPFTDQSSLENLSHCWRLALQLELNEGEIQNVVSELGPIAMRLEMKSGTGGSLLINDTYNADMESLSVALNFQKNHSGKAERILIISEMMHTGLSEEELNLELGRIINGFDLQQVVGIGTKLDAAVLNLKVPLAIYKTTEDFLKDIFRYQFSAKSILIKGARHHRLEKIIQKLESKTHETVLNIHLDRMVHNLNYYRAKLSNRTGVMAMVKAFSYGSGTIEIAKLLEFHKVNYLGVAYADEGIVLRKAGVNLPVMVMNPEVETYPEMLAFRLEPEIFNLNRLKRFAEAVTDSGNKSEFPIHIKLETGMNRLGFKREELSGLVKELKRSPQLKIQSVFSHLAASEDEEQADFSRAQIHLFQEMCNYLKSELNYDFIQHISNSGGISRYPEAHFDMVRLGIGLYGIGFNPEDRKHLQPVSELYASVSQIKHIMPGDSVGYGRSFIAEKEMDIAVVSIGYADGFRRSLSKGVGTVFIGDRSFSVVGAVCMDMAMIDVTGSEVQEGDKVEIFGPNMSIYKLAEKMDTIPYEVLTNIGQRVKRVYSME